MYFSKKNKNHMYGVLSKVILEETGITILNHTRYIDIFQLNYHFVFDDIFTDELSILNKEIINRIGKIIIDDINDINDINEGGQNKESSTERKGPVLTENKVTIKPLQSVLLYSSQRIMNPLLSLNRYNFTINVDFNEFTPKKFTLIKDTNSLFSNSNINVLFNDQDNYLFQFVDAYKLGDMECYTYECQTDDIIQCKDSLKIQIRNYLMNDPLSKSDMFVIVNQKQITYQTEKYLCLEIENHDIAIGDELGLLSSDKIETSVFVKKIENNYILTNPLDIDMSKCYSCLQVNKNITLQGLV